MQIAVASELVELGSDNDGEGIIGERFAVRVTAASGRRWEHERSWTAEAFPAGYDSQGWPTYRRVERETAECAAQRLADAVREAIAAGFARESLGYLVFQLGFLDNLPSIVTDADGVII